MAEEDKEISGKSGSRTNPKEKGLSCEVCGENPSKYKCPGCSIRSCSLHCVKAHKQASGCNGKRQLTKFVPLSKFDDNLLISDYNMLEDVKRVADNAQRQRLKTCKYSHFRLPFPLKNLRRAAASQRTKILFLSTGMSKRQTNQSFYNNWKKTISWTIEWRFYSTDVVLLDHGVDENRSIRSVIENHLKPGPWNHQLKRFCDEPVESLKFFIRKYPKGPKSPFVDLYIAAPIREQLANLVIVEYPVIHVFLPSHRYDFEVVKAASCHKLSKPVNHRENSPKGVYFREEEIEEDNTSNPQVLDLMKHLQSDEVSGSPHQPKKNETKTNDMLGSPLASSIKSSERVYENMDLDVDQGIIDSYADLISEVNPDVFFDFDGLDFDGVFEDLGIEKRDDQTIVEGFTAVEELEEGEISA